MDNADKSELRLSVLSTFDLAEIRTLDTSMIPQGFCHSWSLTSRDTTLVVVVRRLDQIWKWDFVYVYKDGVYENKIQLDGSFAPWYRGVSLSCDLTLLFSAGDNTLGLVSLITPGETKSRSFFNQEFTKMRIMKTY